MKKFFLTVLALAAALMSAGCQQPKENASHMQMIYNDIYGLQIPQEWQYDIIDHHDGLPASGFLFKDGAQIVGYIDLIEIPEGQLKNLPQAIHVYREKTIGEFVGGIVEVVGDAVGGDTNSQYHLLIPFTEDTGEYSYFDLVFKMEFYESERALTMAESIVLRSRQILGYIVDFTAEQLTVDAVESVNIEDITRLKSSSGLSNDALSTNKEKKQEKLSLSPKTAFYLLDSDENFQTVSVDEFADFWSKEREWLYYITIKDDVVMAIEQFNWRMMEDMT